MEKISLAARVKNEEILRAVESITKRMKVNRVGHIMSRDCLLKHVIEGKIKGRIEVMRRRRRRCQQTLDDFEEIVFVNLKKHTLDCTLENSLLEVFWRPVVRWKTERINEICRVFECHTMNAYQTSGVKSS
jgi:hypothetical protein